MTDKQNSKTAKRSVSKPRLLKALLATMEARDIGSDASISVLITGIEKDIVEEAMNR